MAAGTYMVRGRKFRTGSVRRYVVVAVTVPLGGGGGVYKRTDRLSVAQAEQERLYRRGMAATVIIDTHTGEEVGR